MAANGILVATTHDGGENRHKVEPSEFTSPELLGAETLFFPPLNKRIALRLIETRTFGSRVVYASYQRVQERPGPLPEAQA